MYYLYLVASSHRDLFEKFIMIKNNYFYYILPIKTYVKKKIVDNFFDYILVVLLSTINKFRMVVNY